jgi:hypothetical protein
MSATHFAGSCEPPYNLPDYGTSIPATGQAFFSCVRLQSLSYSESEH